MIRISSKYSLAHALLSIFLLLGLISTSVFGFPSEPEMQPLCSYWKLQDAAKVSATPEQVSQATFKAADWYPATVPGTVLTTLVNNKVYPEPLYGENNRPDKIPESLCRSSYWYRTSFSLPENFAGCSIWLNFDGINYSAEIWVNGASAGFMKGAFARGIFDITRLVKPGAVSTLAVLVHAQPNPGNPVEHNIANGSGRNGGISAVDGPTFLCAIGWDWIPGIRDRDTGIWQKVFLSTTGPVRIDEPFVSSDLSLPRMDSADIKVQVTLKNGSDQPQKGTLKGTIGENSSAPDYAEFQQSVEVPPNSSKVLTLDASTTPALRLKNPKLWWPNGYGAPNLYPVHLSFDTAAGISDSTSFKIGIRKMAYVAEGSDNRAVSVNGVRVVCKGGDWGMDEALKRIPRERLEALIRYHQQANFTMIRNWVGQSTEEDFYELCDQYGIMLWDEFFQPNPGNGPNPTDLETYMANAREKIVRFRNHPSIAIRCGRNEGKPPPVIDDALAKLMTESDPSCLYQPSSTDGRGVHSGGPYAWREPAAYYHVDTAFKTEIGSVSVPTLEAVQAMMPKNDWETINDDWAEHDLGRGNQEGDAYPSELSVRYGKTANLADFVRKAQLANYEAFRSMYEGRFAKLFAPVTGVITWMSNPAQPSFIWQLYSWDLEPNASLFATRKACEPIHIMLNEVSGHLLVINNPPTACDGTATVTIYNPDGAVASKQDLSAHAAGSAATDLGLVEQPSVTAHLQFVKLQLRDATGAILSDNFYWRAGTEPQNDLQALQSLPVVKLEASVNRRDDGGKTFLEVTLRNPSKNIVLTSHLQLRRSDSGERVLPVYYSDNYVSLVPQEVKTLSIKVATADLQGQKPLVVLDGWNVDVTPVSSTDCDVALNKNALVSSWPTTGIPVKWFDKPLSQIKIACGARRGSKDFWEDMGYDRGVARGGSAGPVDLSAQPSLPAGLFKAARAGECTYTFPMKPTAGGYMIELVFAEGDFKPKPPPKNNSTPASTEPNNIGKRIFNVAINDEPVLKNFDICVAAGKRDKAVVEEFKGIHPNKEGNITITFHNGPASQPLINGIEVLPSKNNG